MANLNDLSIFLKKDDIKADDIITFIDPGEITEVDFSLTKDGSSMKKVFQITIELPDGREKILTMNKTSRMTLAAVWGNITEKWVKKQAKCTYQKQLSFGKMTDVLVLIPAEENG